MDAIATCQICTEDFHDDPTIGDKKSSHLPVQSAKCPHRTCYSCVLNLKMERANILNKDPCDIKWIACPECRAKTCFNTEDPVVDLGRCEALRMLRGIQSNAAPGGETLQAASVSPATGQYDANTDDDSRFSGGEYEPADDDETAEPENPSPKRARLSSAMNGEMGDTGLELDDDAKKWRDLVSKDGVDVYRMRTMQAHSSNNDDPYGRKCAFWCIKNGYVASASLILTVLPEEIQKDGEACRDYVRNTDYEEFKETCRQCKAYYSLEQGVQSNQS